LRKYVAQKAHLRQILNVLLHERENAKKISERKLTPRSRGHRARQLRGFWESFDLNAFEHIEFLENHISP